MMPHRTIILFSVASEHILYQSELKKKTIVSDICHPVNGKLKSQQLSLHTAGYREALRVASCLEQFDNDGFVGLQFQRVQSHRPQAVHSRAGHKHAGFRQARGPGRIKGVKLRADVEQDEEVDTTPGAQEGQDRGRRRRGKSGVGRGVGDGGIEGEDSEAAVQKSFFSGSGATEGGKESYS